MFGFETSSLRSEAKAIIGREFQTIDGQPFPVHPRNEDAFKKIAKHIHDKGGNAYDVAISFMTSMVRSLTGHIDDRWRAWVEATDAKCEQLMMTQSALAKEIKADLSVPTNVASQLISLQLSLAGLQPPLPEHLITPFTIGYAFGVVTTLLFRMGIPASGQSAAVIQKVFMTVMGPTAGSVAYNRSAELNAAMDPVFNRALKQAGDDVSSWKEGIPFAFTLSNHLRSVANRSS